MNLVGDTKFEAGGELVALRKPPLSEIFKKMHTMNVLLSW
jgi:hypothetical protein